jgi:hypothetical protein
MEMRSLLICALVALPSVAAADTFGGFGGNEDAYLVGRDQICTPLKVSGGKAKGVPSCAKASADQVANLSVKTAKAVRGLDASHTASATGRKLEISAKENVVVTWESPDPISKVNDVYVSKYETLIAVEYTVRRGGRDMTDVVVFDTGKRSGTTATPQPQPTETATTPPPAESAALKKAVKAARKAKGKAAIKAWGKVIALDAEHSEAQYGLAIAHAKAKKKDLVLAALETLAASQRTDAVEYLVQARFDKAFAALRADARFRAAVGLDTEKAGFYVRLMGNGGTWEQAETSCDTPGVRLGLKQDRTFKLTITSTCSGARYEDSFKGRWEAKEPQLILVLPNKGKDDESFPCQLQRDGDEDAISCVLDQDLSFVVRPVRR